MFLVSICSQMDDFKFGGLNLDDDGDDNIKLISKEKTEHVVSKKAAMLSKLIKTTLEGDALTEEIVMFHIEGQILDKIITYMNYHVDVPCRKISKPLQSNDMSDLVDRFDANFVDVDQETMFKLLLAANYMDVKPLLYLVCAKTATLLKDKTPDQIRKTFNIRGDYTPEEEEQVRREHRDLIG